MTDKPTFLIDEDCRSIKIYSICCGLFSNLFVKQIILEKMFFVNLFIYLDF